MIRIPPDAEPNLRSAFQDVEDRLRRLETETRITPPVETDDLRDKTALLESQMNELSLFRDTEGALADKKTGVPLRVLHETGQWAEPIGGLVKQVPPWLGTARVDVPGSIRKGHPSQKVNVLGSLAVTGALSADIVRARLSRIGLVYARSHGSTNQTLTTNTTTGVVMTGVELDPFNFHSTVVNSHQMKVPSEGGFSGWYFYHACIRWEAEASPAGQRTLRVEKNTTGSTDPNKAISIETVHPSINAALDQNVSGIVHLGVGEGLELYAKHVQGGDSDIIKTSFNTPYFEMIRLGGL